MNRLRFSSLCCLMAALLGLAPICSFADSATPPVPVTATHPQRGSISRWITLPAVIRANQRATLNAKIAGYLKSIRVDRGDAVQAGDVLAEIEVPELLAERATALADVEVTRADFQRVDAARRKSPDLITAQTVDLARGKYEVAQANLKKNDTLLAYTKIVAPFAGVVTKRWVDPGALIPAATAGSPPQSSAVLTLMDFSTVRLEVDIPEPECPQVKDGLPVEIRVEELPGRTFQGKIARYAHALDEATRTMAAEVDLPNPAGQLQPGMFATAKIAVETKADAVIVPLDAVLLEKAGASVFTVADGKAHKTPVKIGFNDGKSAEITDGIALETPIILLGKTALADGQAVAATEAR